MILIFVIGVVVVILDVVVVVVVVRSGAVRGLLLLPPFPTCLQAGYHFLNNSKQLFINNLSAINVTIILNEP